MRRPGALAVVAAALAAAGAGLPSLEVFAAGCGLLFATIAALVCVLAGARTVSVSRRVPLLEVEEEGALAVFLSSRHPRRWPLRVEALAGSEWLPIGSSEISVAVPIGRRGPHELPPTPVRVTDPLGLAERRLSGGASARVLALPRPQADDPLVAAARARGPSGDPEPGGLRSYVPGAPLSRIYWRSLARGGELMQHDLSTAPGREAAPLVVVDTRGAAEPEAVDRAARRAAAAVTRLARGGGVRVLLPGDRAPVHISADLRRWPQVHRRLALLEAGTSATPPRANERGPVVSIRALDDPQSSP